MELRSIGVMSRQFGISARTLRYYEQIGLISSTKKGESAYRYYDAQTIARLRRIIILRKLRIPLKQIANILQSENATTVIESFQQNLNEINDEITALSTIKNILEAFIARLNQSCLADVKINLLDDESLLDIADSLTISRMSFKEERMMEELNKASEQLEKLSDGDVRITYLPPMTVASIIRMGVNGHMRYFGSGEMQTCIDLHNFIREQHLAEAYPSLRHIGFTGEKSPDEENHAYERWVSIPDHMEVASPFVRKYFPGGLYAAFLNPTGDFDGWKLLCDWGMNNEKYTYDAREPFCNHGLLEEHLNAINKFDLPDGDQGYQIDLLFPIKAKG